MKKLKKFIKTIGRFYTKNMLFYYQLPNNQINPII